MSVTEDRPDASDFPVKLPPHVCWRNGGVECRRCDMEEQAEEAGVCIECGEALHPFGCWSVPADGAGTWAHTAPHANSIADLAVAFIACLLGLTVLVGLIVAGRAAMCSAYDGALSYCAVSE